MSNANPHVRPMVVCAAPNCGKVKQLTNHWLIMISNPRYGNCTLFTWQPDILGREDALPLCGESCASKMMSIWMSKVKEAQLV